MIQIDVVIPTYKRSLKLQNSIKTIYQAKKDRHNINLYIYFSNYDELRIFNNFNHWIKKHIVNNYKVPEFWNSHLKNMVSDVMIYLNDDVLVEKDFFEIIERDFIKIFPDLDGIMGINQSNLISNQKLDSAYGIIGKKYLERFPDKNPWCTDYYRFFADKELGEYAKSINKFYYNENIKITHLHPSIDHRQIDETHLIVRQWLKQDQITYQERQKKGWLWGKNYNLLSKEEYDKVFIALPN